MASVFQLGGDWADLATSLDRPPADQNLFIDCPVRFQANRLKNFFPSEWHREHAIVYVKADLLKVTGRVPGGVGI